MECVVGVLWGFSGGVSQGFVIRELDLGFKRIVGGGRLHDLSGNRRR